MSSIFKLDSEDKKQLINSIKDQILIKIEESKELLYLRNTNEKDKEAVSYSRRYINKILDLLNNEDDSIRRKMMDKIVSGKIDKKFLGLKNSVVGEDGGIYILLNRIDEETRKILVNKVGEGGYKTTKIEVITDSTVADCFTSDISNILYTPKICEY